MANIQIPNLPVAISLNGTEQVEIVQSDAHCARESIAAHPPKCEVFRFQIVITFRSTGIPAEGPADYAF